MKKIEKLPDGRIRVSTINDLPSRTQKHLKDSTDINLIMERYKKRPDPSIFVKSGKGVYGDFSQVKSYQEAVMLAQTASQVFLEIPAKVRQRFQNDPQQLINFLNDPKNIKEGIELGLIEKPKENITYTKETNSNLDQGKTEQNT